jgi:ATP-binding cassette, subfamily B, bacterial
MNTPQPALDFMRRYLRPHWPKVLALFGLIGLQTLADLGMPRLLSGFVDQVSTGGQLETLLPLGLGFLGLTLLGQIGSVFNAWLATDIGLRATNAIRSDMVRHCLSLDMGWHNNTTPGSLIERIDGDATKLNAMMSQLIPQVASSLLLLTGAVIAVFLLDVRAGAVMLLISLVWLLIIHRTRNLAEPAFAAERESSAALFGVIEEHLAGTEDVRANGATGYVMRRFEDVSRVWRRTVLKSRFVGTVPWNLSNTYHSLALTGWLAMCIWFFFRGEISLGLVLALYRYMDLIGWPVQMLGRQLTDLQEATASAVRLRQLANTQPALIERGQRALPSGPLPVSLTQVSFGYADSVAQQLSQITLNLKPGQVLGLLGRTGAGKTTLARLLTRLYDPTHGDIVLGDVPLPEIAPEVLRRRVTMVTQDIQLFGDTLRNNLTLFEPGLTDDRLWRALETVGLREWAEAQPNGLDTRLSGGGIGLSAGETQLLAFARAFLRDPGLVILDEASSRLDPATEQRLERAVDALLRDRTAVIIAHRIATVERADVILVLEAGVIVEHGPRDVLAGDPSSRYAALRNHGAQELLA